MTMPSQYSQLLPIMLLLAATTHAILASDAEQQPITLAGCPDKCGNISIPFPFGMKPGCFRDGFEVICNYSFNPPRAFLPQDSSFHIVGDANYSANYTGLNYPGVMNWSYAPVELIDISASKSELRGYGAVRSDCAVLYERDHLMRTSLTLSSKDQSPVPVLDDLIMRNMGEAPLDQPQEDEASPQVKLDSTSTPNSVRFQQTALP